MINASRTTELVNPFVFGPKTNTNAQVYIPKLDQPSKREEIPITKGIHQYPYSDDFEYETSLEYINLDEECRADLLTTGFRITAKQNINQDLKNNADTIFSYRYGQGLEDESPFRTTHRCECGYLEGKLNNGIICPHCHKPVKYVDNDFEIFGWIILDNYVVIHPSLYTVVRSLIGPNLDKILDYVEVLDQDGNIIPKQPTSIEDSFIGIGMIEFYNRFDEIIQYYASTKKTKAIYYEEIMRQRDAIFTHSIPVFTKLLRPIKVQDGRMIFEGTNSDYQMISKEAVLINKKSEEGDLTRKKEENILYHIQQKLNHLNKSIDAILSGKKGTYRGLFGGRYNFTARCVITPDPSLRVDEIALPYACLMELMKEAIINVIQKTYNINYLDAYLRWFDGLLKEDPMLVSILNSLISKHSSGRGIPFVINRNPTLHYGSIMQMYCTKVNTDSYAMKVPLQILAPLNADFDGDVLNILWIINKTFQEDAERVFNPRNAMFISRNDGYMDGSMTHNRDTMLSTNNVMLMARDSYTEEERNNIMRIKQKALAS